ncbi:MAG: hypothetical protein R2758_03760 [Bacteroidales bacterium]
MSLKHSDLLWVQASDNYVTVCYQAQGKLNRFMLRNTLRALEEELRSRLSSGATGHGLSTSRRSS